MSPPLSPPRPELAGERAAGDALANLLPACVAVSSGLTPTGESPLEEEEVYVARAIASRREEFLGARAHARRAMGRLGVVPSPVLRGASREPIWPLGLVGSITHAGGLVAAAVARGTDVAALGIDLEPAHPISAAVARLVAMPDERAGLAQLPPGLPWDTVVFSAKESVYKAWFPLARRWLEFADVHVALAPGGTFRARLLRDPLPVEGELVDHVDGRFVVAHGVVHTAVALPAPAHHR